MTGDREKTTVIVIPSDKKNNCLLQRKKKALERSETPCDKLVVLKGPRHEIFKDSVTLIFLRFKELLRQ